MRIRILVALVVMAACAGTPVSRPEPPGAEGVAARWLGHAEALWDEEGEVFSLGDVRGQVGTVVVLTAGWCGDQRTTLHALGEPARDFYRRGVQVVVLVLDADATLGEVFRSAVARPHMPVFLSDAGTRRRVRAETVLPTTLLLDGADRVVRRFDGDVPVAALRRLVPELAPELHFPDGLAWVRGRGYPTALSWRRALRATAAALPAPSQLAVQPRRLDLF